MTPERKKYLAKCSKRELWLRSEIRDIKRDIYWQKQIISNANEEWLETGAKCELWHKKQLLMTLHNELNRLKGMDRVVVPICSFCLDVEDGNIVDYDVCYCRKCGAIVGGDLSERCDYCPKCGRKILWDKVKQ